VAQNIQYRRMYFLKKIILLITLALLLAACSAQPASPLQDYRGKWVIINYWATWCKPCYQEIAELNAFYAAHQNKDVILLGVNYDHASPEQLPKLIKQIGAKFPMLSIDPAQQLGIKEIAALPTTYLIGPDGKVKKVLLGEQTRKGLEAALR
jgi:thiol-disulfide isomerase/thioredoxin